jgi:hypothetical protein
MLPAFFAVLPFANLNSGQERDFWLTAWSGRSCDPGHTRLAPEGVLAVVSTASSDVAGTYNPIRWMRSQARPGSLAEARHYYKLAQPQGGWAEPGAIAAGIPADLPGDLVFHGGKTVPQMEFQNIFLGG